MSYEAVLYMKIIEKLWPKIRHRLAALGILLLTVLLIWGAFGQSFRSLLPLIRQGDRDAIVTYLAGEAERAGSNRFVIPFDRQGLADFLCVERSALSAEIGKLRREGVLESERSRFTLLQKPKL